MSKTEDAVGTPHLGLLLTEAPRAIGEFGGYLAARPLLRRLPRGDGHPVLILPGMGADDLSTRPMRRVLQRLGYHVHRWHQGRNVGHAGLGSQLRKRLHDLHVGHGWRVSLIGWSLGGIYARELAKVDPDLVRFVITLGSPFARVGASNVEWLYERLSGRRARAHADPTHLAEPPPVPSTAIYSRGDGIVSWRACLEPDSPHTENVEVCGSHCGLGHNPAVLYAVADRLAQPEDAWVPFRAGGRLRRLYPRAV